MNDEHEKLPDPMESTDIVWSAPQALVDLATSTQRADVPNPEAVKGRRDRQRLTDREMAEDLKISKVIFASTDVMSVFDGVTPVPDAVVDGLFPIMRVTRGTPADVPDEIRFIFGDEQATGDMTRYVCTRSMPIELKRVVTAYLTMLRGSPLGCSTTFIDENERFLKAVRALAHAAEKAIVSTAPDGGVI